MTLPIANTPARFLLSAVYVGLIVLLFAAGGGHEPVLTATVLPPSVGVGLLLAKAEAVTLPVLAVAIVSILQPYRMVGDRAEVAALLAVMLEIIIGRALPALRSRRGRRRRTRRNDSLGTQRLSSANRAPRDPRQVGRFFGCWTPSLSMQAPRLMRVILHLTGRSARVAGWGGRVRWCGCGSRWLPSPISVGSPAIARRGALGPLAREITASCGLRALQPKPIEQRTRRR